MLKVTGIDIVVKVLKNTNTSIIFFISIIILGLFSSFLSIISTQFVSIIIDKITNNTSLNLTYYEKIIYKFGDIVNIDSGRQYIVFLGIMISLAAIIRNIFCYIASVNSNRMIRNYRERLFEKLIECDYNELNKKTNGDIIYNTINNTNAIDNVFSTPLYTILSDFFDFIWITLFVTTQRNFNRNYCSYFTNSGSLPLNNSSSA